MRRLELGDVIGKTDRAYHYVHAADEGHGEETLVHMDKRPNYLFESCEQRPRAVYVG